jgi:C4-dicarboxylate-specific signal transduction histidine kinase
MSRELAHDLKGPIQALFLFDFEDVDPEMESAFRGIVDRMAATVDQMSRIYLPRPLNKGGGAFTVPELIEALQEISGVQRTLPSAQLTFEAPPGLPAVGGNQSEWQHALINLLMNAREAAGPEPGGRVSVVARPVVGGVEIEIRDSGPGIAEDRRDWIFQPFTTTREGPGVRGLGLPVARWLAERNGGSLRLAAAGTGGACFVVMLRELQRG